MQSDLDEALRQQVRRVGVKEGAEASLLFPIHPHAPHPSSPVPQQMISAITTRKVGACLE